jgi:hypothetical protein
MRTIPTRKYSGVTLSEALGAVAYRRPVEALGAVAYRRPVEAAAPRLRGDERGQGILEYLLVLMIVLGMIFVLARPVIAHLQKNFEKGMKGSIFKDDPSGSSFYYFPLK